MDISSFTSSNSLSAVNLGAAYMSDNHSVGSTGINNVPDFESLLKRAAETTKQPELQQSTVAPNTSKTAVIDKTDKLYEQCLELEIFMVKTLISSMRNTVQKSGLVDEGFAGKMYEDMLYDEYARVFTQNANFGMAEMAYLELSGQRSKVIVR